MAGYSGTPLAKKLGVKAGHAVALFGAPDGFESSLDGLTEGARVRRDPRGRGRFDVIVAFFTRGADMNRRVGRLSQRLDERGGLWIAWPKKASGMPTDLDGNVVRRAGLALGLVDNKVCAIDDTWSGLRFVVRVKDRRGGR